MKCYSPDIQKLLRNFNFDNCVFCLGRDRNSFVLTRLHYRAVEDRTLLGFGNSSFILFNYENPIDMLRCPQYYTKSC